MGMARDVDSLTLFSGQHGCGWRWDAYERTACPRRRGHGTRLIVLYYNLLASQCAKSVLDFEGYRVRRVSSKERMLRRSPSGGQVAFLCLGELSGQLSNRGCMSRSVHWLNCRRIPGHALIEIGSFVGLETRPTNSYVSPQFAAHRCGDERFPA
jgi:hypothetical protein